MLNKFKPFIFIVLALVTLAGAATLLYKLSDVRGSSQGMGAVEWVKPVPKGPSASLTVSDFMALDTLGRRVQLLGSTSKAQVVNFWASWCAPCLEEIPSFIEYAKRNRESVRVIAISSDSDAKEFKKAVQLFPEFEQNIHVIFDPNKSIMRAYGVEGFPETFFISIDPNGSNGKITKKAVGPIDWSKL